MRLRSTSILPTMLVLALGLTGTLFGQGGADTSKGSLSVEVQDSSGAIVQNANVTLSGSMGSRVSKSDSRGVSIFYNLVPGIYSVRVEVPGFRAAEIKNAAVSANERTPLRVVMEPGAVAETVQVTESAATVDTTSTTTGSTLTSDIIQNIPVARNVAGLFALAPGAAPGGGTDNNSTPNQSYNPSISGASGLENQYIIDGVNATDQGYGAFGVWSNVYGSMGSGVNFDFIKEVQVKTGGFEAQYGQAMGGILNIVTNSGGNELHGSVYAYLGPNGLEASYKQPNVLRTSSPLTELLGRSSYDFGFNLGGPLVKNKLFWYGGFNPKYASLDRQGPPNFGARALGVQDWKSRNYNWVGKLNYDITQNHRIEGTAFGDPSRDPSGAHRDLIRDTIENVSSADYGTRNWAVKYSGVLTSTTLLAGSFAWNHSYFTETPANNLYSVRDYSKPKANSAYTNAGGLGFLENNDSNNKQLNVMLTKNVNVLGGHTFDLGYSYNSIDYAAIRFYSGPNFGVVAGKGISPGDVGKPTYGGFFYQYPNRSVGGVVYPVAYRLIRGNFSDPSVGTAGTYHDSFLQDAWQLNRYITIKAGLRWEQQEMHGNTTRYVLGGNWAPRIGFVIDPTGHRKTKLFGNWGRFFEKVPQDPAVRAMSTESGYLNQYFTGLPPSASTLIAASAASPTGTEPTIIYGGTKAMYQEEIVAGVEHELPGGVVISARFIHRDVKRIVEDISGITVEQALAGSGQQYVIANPSAALDIFHNAVTCTSGPNCDTDSGYTLDSGQLGADGKPDGFPDARRLYKAFEFTAEKRFGNNWSLYGNYRVAKLFGNYEGLFRNDNGQSDPNITSLFDFAYSPALADQFKVGVLPTDRRHIANIYGNYMFGKRFNVGLGWNVLSGAPISKLLAHPAYGNAGEIPSGGRGAFGRTPTQNYWNARAEYSLPIKSDTHVLKFAIDTFNLFNRKSITNVDQNFELSGAIPNSDFLKPLTYARPFYARLSIRFQF
ncbi:MAG: TonB-dependent receptor [Bryobacterales bacterium]|nr:TonB-dependent receptor [Bryobacterales bacterium]